MSRWKTETGRRARWTMAVAGAAGSLGATALGAQAQEGFVKASEIAKESLPAGPLLYTAYALVWIILIGYIFLLWRRVDRVERELRDVAGKLASGKRP